MTETDPFELLRAGDTAAEPRPGDAAMQQRVLERVLGQATADSELEPGASTTVASGHDRTSGLEDYAEPDGPRPNYRAGIVLAAAAVIVTLVAVAALALNPGGEDGTLDQPEPDPTTVPTSTAALAPNPEDSPAFAISGIFSCHNEPKEDAQSRGIHVDFVGVEAAIAVCADDWRSADMTYPDGTADPNPELLACSNAGLHVIVIPSIGTCAQAGLTAPEPLHPDDPWIALRAALLAVEQSSPCPTVDEMVAAAEAEVASSGLDLVVRIESNVPEGFEPGVCGGFNPSFDAGEVVIAS
ncbi:MAG: hypothetical protein HKN26_06070 [Acidimicrobiales bacterium]|nr:hypothetical protein [Acidimicrobiales bacterium]